MPNIIPNVRNKLLLDSSLYPSLVKKIKAGFADMKLDNEFPLITIREDAGDSHPVFPSCHSTVIVTAWVKGDETSPYKKLVSDIGSKIITDLNKKNVAMTDANAIINMFIKTGGFPAYIEDEKLWSYPISFETWYEENPSN